MSLIAYATYLNGHGPIVYAALGASTLELMRIVWNTRYDERESCWKGFVGCGRVGMLVTLGLGAEYMIQELAEDSE